MPGRRSKFIVQTLLAMGAAAATAGMTVAAAAPSAAAPPATRTAASAAPPSDAAAPPMSDAEVIDMLDQTVDWYRALATQQQFATQPSDLLILYENRQIAGQVTSLAFDVARAAATLLAAAPPTGPKTGDASTPAQNVAQIKAKFDAQQRGVQADIDATRRQLGTAPRSARQRLQAKLAELHGELDLIDTKQGIVAGIAGVMNGPAADGSAAGALRPQIDAMAVALPSIAEPSASPAASGAPGSSASANSAVAASRFGIWDVAAAVFKLSEKMSAIDGVDRRTAALEEAYAHIRGKTVTQMRAMSAHGDGLMAQADAADSAALDALRGELDALAAEFKQASAILIPLSKQSTLLQQYRHNLGTWHDAVKAQSRDEIKALGLRLAILMLVLGAVFALAAVWHRTVLKYVHDSRRRYQLLLLRRIALWSLVVIIVGFTFASELSSLATFAGLITAGLAVAMQSVLVSIVGYFFLIGKYGIRIGDRVQIGEVNGEIIELGMVRMYLMEFAGQSSASPTGRVAAFPNSVVFQVSSGLFKQLPGVALAWHDITLSIPAGVDYADVKERLFRAANEALADYREEIERQSREMQRTTVSSSGGEALPTVQLSYSVKGVDAHVRYPVHLAHAAEIDERMSRALLQVVSGARP